MLNVGKLIVIVGPTASGKSDLGVWLAKKLNGEIISADSRQIYRGLDISTGKITKKEMQGIKHYMLNIADPKKQYSVAQYQKAVQKILKDIFRHKKLTPSPYPPVPILIGGTGHYIDAVAYHQNFPDVPPNKKLRSRLAKLDLKTLFQKLKQLDPGRAKTIEQKNKRRLIRALEVIAQTKKPISPLKQKSPYNILWLGITWPKQKLHRRINQRLEKRLQQGMIQEIKKLLTKGVSHKRLQKLGLEPRFISLYLQKKLTKSEMVAKLKTETHHYARRQMVWFKRNKNIHWIKNKKEAFRIAQSFLKNETNL